MSNAVVGRSATRIDATGKAQGKSLYSADLNAPGMLYAKILRSPLPRGLIKAIDTTEAEKLAGVKRVVTAKDAPRGPLGGFVQDERLLARDHVLQIGERVAAVAAISPEVAEEALDLIRVDYEELSPVLDPESALSPDAPLVHERADEYVAVWPAIRHGNVCAHVKVRRGDAEQALIGATAVYAQRFATTAAHHAYLEPCCALAAVDEAGRLIVRASTQSPFVLRAALAGAFGLPLTKVRVIGGHVGGGFGGKTQSLDYMLCALLALQTGRPVKLMLSREEELINSNPRHPVLTELRLGTDRDGRLVAGLARIVIDAGSTAKFAPMVASNMTGLIFGCYRVPNVAMDAYAVYTNKVSGGAMRGPGSTQACFAVESAMDELARQLGMHPAELRLRNAVGEGDVSATGQVLPRMGLKEALTRAREVMRQAEARRRPGGGVGMAVGIWQGGGMASSSARVSINPDGTVVLATGAQDIGQGSNTVLAQIVAEELGAQLEDVNVTSGDTDAAPPDYQSVGSRVTFTAGSAVRRAAGEARRQLLEKAAERLEAATEDLEARRGRIWVRGTPDKAVTFAQVARAAQAAYPITGSGFWEATPPAYDPALVQGSLHAAFRHPVVNVQVAEVAVDEETGQPELLALHAIQDVGYALNPTSVEGQMEGGASMGVGFALSERYIFGDDGRVLNANLTDYKLPTALDVPAIQVGLVEAAADDGPFGAKGVGEPPGIPTAPAIANAIRDAVGVRLTQLPMRAEDVRRALRAKGGAKGAP